MESGGTAKRHRSPAYPAMDLGEAIGRARKLFLREKRNAVHVDVAADAMGYKPGSSLGARAVAALKQFGLLQETGRSDVRSVRLTERALDLIDSGANDPSRLAALRGAALAPVIFSAMSQEWPDSLPSDAQIRRWLRNRSYSEDAIPIVIRNFRSTLELAGPSTQSEPGEEQEPGDAAAPMSHVTGSGQASSVGGDGRSAEDPAERRGPLAPPTGEPISLSVPVGRNRFATLTLPHDITLREYRRITDYLNHAEAVLFEDWEAPLRSADAHGTGHAESDQP